MTDLIIAVAIGDALVAGSEINMSLLVGIGTLNIKIGEGIVRCVVQKAYGRCRLVTVADL